MNPPKAVSWTSVEVGGTQISLVKPLDFVMLVHAMAEFDAPGGEYSHTLRAASLNNHEKGQSPCYSTPHFCRWRLTLNLHMNSQDQESTVVSLKKGGDVPDSCGG